MDPGGRIKKPMKGLHLLRAYGAWMQIGFCQPRYE